MILILKDEKESPLLDGQDMSEDMTGHKYASRRLSTACIVTINARQTGVHVVNMSTHWLNYNLTKQQAHF